MTLLGELSLWVAVLMAGWTVVASLAGGLSGRSELVASGQRALYAATAFAALATIGLWYALYWHDFSLVYVASHSSFNLAGRFTPNALWAGPSGSLLFFAFVLLGCGSVATVSNRQTIAVPMPWTAATLGAIAFMFLIAVSVGTNPYERTEWPPGDGHGLDPLLQNGSMLIQTPLLFLGLASASVPFAFTIAALMARELNGAWLKLVRRWTSLSWCFVTIAIVANMWWSYHEPLRGQFWLWDAAENTTLLAWLTSTALLHAIVIAERRGLFSRWCATLVVLTFLIAMTGAFITRSSVTQGFAPFMDSAVDSWFLVALVFTAVVSLFVAAKRRIVLREGISLNSILSRESALMSNNIVLGGVWFVTLTGTFLPLLQRAVTGEEIVVDRAFFNEINGFFALVMLVLMGIGVLLPWRRASAAAVRQLLFVPLAAAVVVAGGVAVVGVRNVYAVVTCALAAFVAGTVVQEFRTAIVTERRLAASIPGYSGRSFIGQFRARDGGYIVHLGIALLFSGLAGQWFRKEITTTLKTGDSITAVDPFGHTWKFTSQGFSRSESFERSVLSANFAVSRDSRRMGLVGSEKRQYIDGRGEPNFEATTVPGITGTTLQDMYLVFAGSSAEDSMDVHLVFNPLVRLVWVGGAVIALGGLIVSWPRPELRDIKPRGGP